jgi:putative phosphoesterase
MTVLGVIADTHVPDRSPGIDPRVLEIYRQAGVSQILHAGDICTQVVLDDLASIAPVLAVCGNRDFYALSHLPARRLLEVERVRIGLTHGHGTLPNYLSDKVDFILHGKRVGRYLARALATFPDVDIIIIGHLHLPGIIRFNGRLVFNPGSPCCPSPRSVGPSVGLLYCEAGQVQAEIVFL